MFRQSHFIIFLIFLPLLISLMTKVRQLRSAIPLALALIFSAELASENLTHSILLVVTGGIGSAVIYLSNPKFSKAGKFSICLLTMIFLVSLEQSLTLASTWLCLAYSLIKLSKAEYFGDVLESFEVISLLLVWSLLLQVGVFEAALFFIGKEILRLVFVIRVLPLLREHKINLKNLKLLRG